MFSQPTEKGGISLGRVTALLLLGRAAGYVLALAKSIILARALGVELLGSYAYAMGVAAVFGLLPNMGINTIIIRAIARDRDAGAGLLQAALRAQVLLAGAVMLIVPVFAAILPVQPVPIGYVLLAATQLGIGAMSLPYLGILAGHVRYDRIAAAELATNAAGIMLVLAAAALGGNVATFLWVQVVAAAFAVLVARTAAKPFLPKATGQAVGIGTLLRQAAPFGATAGLQSLYTRLDIILLGQLTTAGALGLYNVAYKPTNLVVSVGATIAAAVFPLMVQQRQIGSPASFVKVTRALGVAAPAMALALTGLAAPLLGALYGNEYRAAAPILAVLSWSAAVSWLYASLGVALQARGYERHWLLSLAGGLALNMALNLWAIPRWGALGAAGATLASEVALLGFGLVLAGRKLGILPSLRPVLVGLGATVVAGAVLWGLRDAGAVPVTLAALVVYAGPLISLGIVTREDATMVLGWIRDAVPGWG